MDHQLILKLGQTSWHRCCFVVAAVVVVVAVVVAAWYCGLALFCKTLFQIFFGRCWHDNAHPEYTVAPVELIEAVSHRKKEIPITQQLRLSTLTTAAAAKWLANTVFYDVS